MNDGIIVHLSVSEIAHSDRPQNLKDGALVGNAGLFLVSLSFSFREKIRAEMNNPKYSLKFIVDGINDPFLGGHPSCLLSSPASLCFLLRCRRIFWLISIFQTLLRPTVL